MSLDELPEPFAKSVRRMKPGQYSRIIPVKHGETQHYYVLYLETVVADEQPPIEEIYFHIRNELERKRARELFSEKLERFRPLVPLVIHYDRLPFTYRERSSEEEV